MQQFFQTLQGKLWIFLSLQFNKATELINETWTLTKPYLEIIWVHIEEMFFYILKYLTLSISFLGKIFSTVLEYSALIKPAFESIYNQNKYQAIGLSLSVLVIMFFWFLMIRHAKRNEMVWKKTWIFIMILFGPVGALTYFFLRKRKLEKQQDKKDIVMMKFFSPMHKD
ncbi:MAG: hypothetical protein ACD_5C00137G0001 [uncultured bacterium]|nr:MAG: hypothetical protein ACD_5C00137G0001 [uncultured bacterium]